MGDLPVHSRRSPGCWEARGLGRNGAVPEAAGAQRWAPSCYRPEKVRRTRESKQHVHREDERLQGRNTSVAKEPTAKPSCLGLCIPDSPKLTLSPQSCGSQHEERPQETLAALGDCLGHHNRGRGRRWHLVGAMGAATHHAEHRQPPPRPGASRSQTPRRRNPILGGILYSQDSESSVSPGPRNLEPDKCEHPPPQRSNVWAKPTALASSSSPLPRAPPMSRCRQFKFSPSS